jgi:hypothetical protein
MNENRRSPALSASGGSGRLGARIARTGSGATAGAGREAGGA